MSASILDEFRFRAQAQADSWNYIVGAIGFNVAQDRGMTATELLNVLRKAEAFGGASLVRRGVDNTLQPVDVYIDSLR